MEQGVRGCLRERGSVTVEAALALSVLALVLVLCLAGVSCALAQVRCADAAREAARLAGRGDDAAAAAAVSSLAPQDATVSISGAGGDTVTAIVSMPAVGGLLPGVTIRAAATAARESLG